MVLRLLVVCLIVLGGQLRRFAVSLLNCAMGFIAGGACVVVWFIV